MTDTEARRLAEQIVRVSGPNNDDPVVIVARHLLALLERTRLTAPALKAFYQNWCGYNDDDGDGFAEAFMKQFPDVTQPEATETLRTDTAHHTATLESRTGGGTGVGSASLPSVGPELLDIGMDAYLKAVPEWLVRKNEGGVLAEPLKAAFLAMTAAQPDPTEGWRDIASAPKDGTHILLLDGDHAFEGFGFKETSWTGIGFDEDYYYVEPTHWMPLPSAPLPNSGGGG